MGRTPRIQGRDFVRIGDDVEAPLMGSIAFGVIDRGTNIIQVRPVSYCILNCIFCSTDAGPRSRWRWAEYRVAKDALVEALREIARFKGGKGLEAHIDTVGDPLLYDKLPELVQEIKDIPGYEVVSLQTHGPTLTYRLADELAAAGLDRINLSIDTLDPEKARLLQGAPYYDVRRVAEVAEYTLRSTSLDITLAPLLLPGYNDEDIPKIVEWGKKIGVGKRSPDYGIQLYLRHRHGRHPPGVRRMRWSTFYRLLKKWERGYGVKLVLREEDFGIRKMRMTPIPYKVGEKVRVQIVARGWLRGEWLAVPLRGPPRTITVIDEAGELGPGQRLSVRVIKNKHNIYLARPA